MGSDPSGCQLSIDELAKELRVTRKELTADIRSGIFSASLSGETVVAPLDELERYRLFVVRRACAKSTTAWQFMGRRVKADAVAIAQRKHRFSKIGRTLTYDVFEYSQTEAISGRSEEDQK